MALRQWVMVDGVKCDFHAQWVWIRECVKAQKNNKIERINGDKFLLQRDGTENGATENEGGASLSP